MRKRNILLSLFSLVFGGICYVVFRENSYVAKTLDNFIYVDIIRKIFSPLSNDMVKYYLPDGLWGISLSCGLIAIYAPKRISIIICALVAFGCGCLWEGAQGLGIVRGTCDFFDVGMYFLASVISIIINLQGEKRNEKD